MLSPLAAGDPLEHVLPHPLFDLGPIHVNNQMLMAAVSALLMLAIFPVLFRRAYTAAPTGARNLFEGLADFLRTEVFRPALKEHTDRFCPFLWTLFFFILFCNLLGSIPVAEIVSLIQGKRSHLGGTATGNVNTTGALALCALFFIHANGVAQVYRALRAGTYGHHEHRGHEAHQSDEHHPHGAGIPKAGALALPLYLWNFAPHPFKPKPGEGISGWFADLPVWFMLLVLELVGAIIKPVALTIRLFANMIAGHLVLGALVALIVMSSNVLVQVGIGIPVTGLSLLIRLLELFVAFLQAYIFTFLTTLFVAGAVAPEH